jgi:hypothetical protein
MFAGPVDMTLADFAPLLILLTLAFLVVWGGITAEATRLGRSTGYGLIGFLAFPLTVFVFLATIG